MTAEEVEKALARLMVYYERKSVRIRSACTHTTAEGETTMKRYRDGRFRLCSACGKTIAYLSPV